LINSEVRLLGARLKEAGVHTILINTENRFTANHEAVALARTLGAEYESLLLGGVSSVAGAKV
jgi:hypothetical protein